MPEWFHALATHCEPHPDEYTAILLARKVGEREYPGISTAPIVYWNAGSTTPDGRPVKDWEREGYFPVGVGGGDTDEHPTFNSPRKRGECALTLVANKLGVRDDPTLQPLFQWTLRNDLQGIERELDLAHLVRVMHWKYPYPEGSQTVLDWAMLALDALYEYQQAFWTSTTVTGRELDFPSLMRVLRWKYSNDPGTVLDWEMCALNAVHEYQEVFLTSTAEEFKDIAQIEGILGPKRKTLKMVTIPSDNRQMASFARSEHGARASIVIQRKSTKNTQIFFGKGTGLEFPFAETSRLVRYAEQNARHKILTTDPTILSAEGIVPGAEVWHCFPEGQMLLNGSLTAPNVPPTKLSLEVIKDLVRIGVNPRRFERSRASACTQGVCTSTLANPCPWYKFHLERCRAIQQKRR